jgi:hypothetical protein
VIFSLNYRNNGKNSIPQYKPMADSSSEGRDPLIAFRCPNNLKRIAEDLAHEDRVSVSELMRQLVIEEVDRREKNSSSEAVPA